MQSVFDIADKLTLPTGVSLTPIADYACTYTVTTPTGSYQLQIVHSVQSPLIPGTAPFKINAYNTPDGAASYKEYFGIFQHGHMFMERSSLEALLGTAKFVSSE